MKKLMTAALAFALILSSCGRAANPVGQEQSMSDVDLYALFIDKPLPQEPEVIRIGIDGTVYDEGMLYSDDGRLKYLDFDTLEISVVCSKDSCAHITSDCQSYGMDNGPFVYAGRIYYFAPGTSGGYCNTVMSADMGGGDRREECCIGDINVTNYTVNFLQESKLYFIANQQTADQNGSIYTTHYLYCCDLETNECKQIFKTVEGYNSGTTLGGIFDGWLYLQSSYTEEAVPYEKYLDPVFDLSELLISKTERYNLETGERELVNKQSAIVLDEMLLTVDEDGNQFVQYHGGPEFVSSLLDTITVFNGMIFSAADGLVFEPRTGLYYELNLEKQDGVYPEIIAYRNGFYIMRNIVTYEFYKISEQELIGPETEPVFKTEPEAEFPYNLKWSPITDNPKSQELAAMPYKEQREVLCAMDDGYYELLSPRLPEQAALYYELLETKPSGHIQYYFTDDYYCYVYTLDSMYFSSFLIDTDLKADCSVRISICEVNIDAQEERTFTVVASNDGSISVTSDTDSGSGSAEFKSVGEEGCGIALTVYPDEGFYVRDISTSFSFSSLREICHSHTYYIDLNLQAQQRVLEALGKGDTSR